MTTALDRYKMMNYQFIVFGGCRYYPSGGARDLLNAYAEVWSAVAFAEGYLHDESDAWAHVWDRTTGMIVWENGDWTKKGES